MQPAKVPALMQGGPLGRPGSSSLRIVMSYHQWTLPASIYSFTPGCGCRTPKLAGGVMGCGPPRCRGHPAPGAPQVFQPWRGDEVPPPRIARLSHRASTPSLPVTQTPAEAHLRLRLQVAPAPAPAGDSSAPPCGQRCAPERSGFAGCRRGASACQLRTRGREARGGARMSLTPPPCAMDAKFLQ